MYLHRPSLAENDSAFAKRLRLFEAFARELISRCAVFGSLSAFAETSFGLTAQSAIVAKR